MTNRPSSMSADNFAAAFAHIFEGTPSIPQKAHHQLNSSHDSPEALSELFISTFHSLTPEDRMTSLRAHPQLTLPPDTASSETAHPGTGLEKFTYFQRVLFGNLNDLYLEKHGFPFTMCVNGLGPTHIIDTMKSRVQGENEVAEACAEMEKIATGRVKHWFGEHVQ